jgi:hypothetical protein
VATRVLAQDPSAATARWIQEKLAASRDFLLVRRARIVRLALAKERPSAATAFRIPVPANNAVNPHFRLVLTVKLAWIVIAQAARAKLNPNQSLNQSRSQRANRSQRASPSPRVSRRANRSLSPNRNPRVSRNQKASLSLSRSQSPNPKEKSRVPEDCPVCPILPTPVVPLLRSCRMPAAG